MSLREIPTSMLVQVHAAHGLMLIGHDCMAVDHLCHGANSVFQLE